ncbi:ribonuclease Z [Changchengzhania lutea]|uniref:ribonuclease Z n=1 Tax=Changchengzhania lutea TaxID=2049305 RepID=UPI00115DBC76|nr:ribonuclease Z [Changchengzhania lutea]
MIIDQHDNISIITQEKATIIKLVKKIRALYPKFKNDNIIVSLTTLDQLGLSDIIEFLELSNTHRAAKQSFVIVTDQVNFDNMPNEIMIVPTIEEAHDIIEMEDMERDLGF